MTTTVQIKTDLWTQFAALAQQLRKRPDRLLEKLVVEYLAFKVTCNWMNRSDNKQNAAD